ncbi:MAG: type II toxin-antitoxin system RnlB family antitoxin [Nostocales cyanobacterium LacPavin_0920_SED1_MAG_38_18]|nr:type II toxin-antitoxin system RnlB family antitoxin [Nostocales cyanobacterium LacPavin_0920_SED1_MAG_38_18]
METQNFYRIESISEEFVVIFCTTYVNPIAYLPSIETDLKNRAFNGKIIFDLLLANGYTSNRFVQAKVVNHKIDRVSMKVVNSVSDFILKKSREFYINNRNFVEDSSLMDEEQQELLRIY